jgi:hypothetical protein
VFYILGLLAVGLSNIYASPAVIYESWSDLSDPLIMGKHFETRFSALPTLAQVTHKKKFWSGDYWPHKKGLINQRWHSKAPLSFRSPSLAELKRMSQDEIASLSPAEKFDIFNSRYHYPLKNEVESNADYRAKEWEGICHGWAPASMNHDEPTPKSLYNNDGILIPFGSADIKGLLSYFYAYVHQVETTHQVGRRCFNGRVNTSSDCQKDLNAGAFHIVMANKIALDNEGFIADLDRFKEVWNHPVVGYRTQILQEGRGSRINSAPGTVRTVRVKTNIHYIDETENYWYPVIGTRHQTVKSQEYQYVLEIDISGQIIGGEWRSTQRPDFLWLMRAPAYFSGEYMKLSLLLND